MKSNCFNYQDSVFHVEKVSLEKIARKVGTPFYAYSSADIQERFNAYRQAFKMIPHLICYSLKANSNLAVCRVFSRLGAGMDIVSGGELKRAVRAGFSGDHIIFSGVGKTKTELMGALRSGVRLINVESEEELKALKEVAASLKRPAPFSLRVNPDVRAGGHPHVSTGTPSTKFGVYYKNILPLYQWASRQKYLKPVGIQSHIGSQITRVAPYKRALTVLLHLIGQLEDVGIRLEVIDLGGGLGVDYEGESPPSPVDLATILLPPLSKRDITLFLEPGRSLVAQAGVLVTRVIYRKNVGKKHFVIVDAAMNDLARPALYEAYHEIRPVKKRRGRARSVDVVGPICESGDFLARNRSLVLPGQGDLLVVLSAGAYGFSMSSQYNSRLRVPEVLISGSRFDVVRRRESYADLVRGETIPSYLNEARAP